MFKENNSTNGEVTSYGESAAGPPLSDNSQKLRIIVALVTIAGILLGLFATRMSAGNIIIAVAFAGTLLVMVLGMDLRNGWVILYFAGTISAIKIQSGIFDFRPDQLVLIWIGIVWLLALVAGKVHMYKVPLVFPLTGLLVINFVSSILYSPDKLLSYRSCFLLATYFLMYIITVQILVEKRDLLRRSPFIFVLIGVMMSLYALLSLAIFNTGIDLRGAYTAAAGVGTITRGGFEEANIMGSFTAVVALMLLAHFIEGSRWNKGILLAAGFSIVSLALLLSFTRGAWIGFAVGAVLLVLVQRPPGNIFSPKGLALILVMTGLFAFIAIPLGNYVGGHTGGKETALSDRLSNLVDFSQGSGEGRKEIETRAIQAWQRNPLTGNGTYSLPQQEPGTTAQGAWLYSSIIQSLQDTGIIGTVFLIWIYFEGIMIGINGYRRCNTRFWKATIIGATVGWIAMITSSQSSSVFWLSFPWLFLGLLVAWATLGPILEENPKPAIPR